MYKLYASAEFFRVRCSVLTLSLIEICPITSLMGIRSLSAYIRKMALDGYCLNLDLPQLRRMSYLLQMCSNNLNQYAKRANESGKIYATDMEDLRQRLDELIDIGRQILSKLAEL